MVITVVMYLQQHWYIPQVTYMYVIQKSRSIVIVICCNSGLQGPTFLVVDPVRISEPQVHVEDHNTKVSPLNTAW